MLSRLLCRASGVENCSLSRTLLARCLSPRISASSRSKSTCVLRLTRDRPLDSVAKRLVSNLSSSVLKENGETVLHAKGSANVNLDFNTNVLNNVFLYKYEKNKFFTALNVFAVIQLVFFLAISYFTSKDLPPRDAERTPLKTYINDNFILILLSATAFAIGTMSALVLVAFSARNVKYLILNKGGKFVTFVTYHPLNKNSSITVPIDMVKCKNYRSSIKNYLPLKVQGRRFYYILDRDGEYVNPELFDHTVGQLRK